MLFYALLIMRRWGLESARRKRLRSLNRIVPALTWRFRHYQKGVAAHPKLTISAR
jgi:hypothetical protein